MVWVTSTVSKHNQSKYPVRFFSTLQLTSVPDTQRFNTRPKSTLDDVTEASLHCLCYSLSLLISGRLLLSWSLFVLNAPEGPWSIHFKGLLFYLSGLVGVFVASDWEALCVQPSTVTSCWDMILGWNSRNWPPDLVALWSDLRKGFCSRALTVAVTKWSSGQTA